MTKVSRVLSGYLARRSTKVQKAVFFVTLPVLAVVSYFCIGTIAGTTAEHPGGRWLEIAFWLTAVGTAFLSYLMMEVLFRSREVHILACYPVRAEDIYAYQLRRVSAGIGISTVPWVVFWSPQLLSEPAVAALCIGLWPAGLAVCSALALAVLVYTGDMAAEKKSQAGFGSMAFSMAPAIALGGSLVSTLLLKLLAEALLKPGFLDAALTAAGITGGAFVIAMLYAARVYRKRYYSMLACFMDNDRIVLNADYEFVGDGIYRRIQRDGGSSKSAALASAFVAQCSRKFTMSAILVIICEISLAAVYFHSAELLGMTSLRPGCFAILPVIVFSHPWLSVIQVEPEHLKCMPVSDGEVRRARLLASVRMCLVPSCLACLAVAVPTAYAAGLAAGCVQGMAVLLVLALVTLLLGHHTFPGKRTSVLLTGICALLFAIVGIF